MNAVFGAQHIRFDFTKSKESVQEVPKYVRGKKFVRQSHY